MISGRLRKFRKDVLCPFQVKPVKDERIIRSTLCTFTEQTMGRACLRRDSIQSPGVAQQIMELVDPTMLRSHARIDHLKHVGQSRTPIGHDQLDVPPFKPSPIEFMKLTVPRCLTIPSAACKGEQPLRLIGQDSIGDEQLHALTDTWPLHP